MKTNNHQEEQKELNEEMLAAIAKLTRAGFLLLIVLIVLFWQNYALIFKKDVPSSALSSIDYILPTLSETAQKGKTIFIANCASCHNKNMRDGLTGPALGGVKERWAAYPTQDLYQWVRNSQAMIQQKHPKALVLWKDWRPTIMNNFNNLKDDEIEAILTYVEEVYAN